MSLEAFQSGLSWLIILRKRENFRQAFPGFDIAKVARFTDADVARLMADAGIVRNRAKIEATIANARAVADARRPLGAAVVVRAGPAARPRTLATSPPRPRSPSRWPRNSSVAGSVSSARRPRTR